MKADGGAAAARTTTTIYTKESCKWGVEGERGHRRPRWLKFLFTATTTRAVQVYPNFFAKTTRCALGGTFWLR